MEQPGKKPGGPGGAAGAGEYLGHGLTWAASTLLFLWLGSLADEWLGTEPWLTLIGAFVGAGAGFYHMYHHLVVAPGQGRRDGSREGGGRTDGREDAP